MPPLPQSSTTDELHLEVVVQTQIVDVNPVLGGWTIESGLTEAIWIFRSGGLAERAARSLARSAAQVGYDAEVRIHDRGGRLIGATRYPSAFLGSSLPLAASHVLAAPGSAQGGRSSF